MTLISIVDSVIEAGNDRQVGLSMGVGSNLFMQDVFMRGFGVHAVLPDGSVLPTKKQPANVWSHATLLAAGRQKSHRAETHAVSGEAGQYTSPVFKNGEPTDGFLVEFLVGSHVIPPPPNLTTQARRTASLPSHFPIQIKQVPFATAAHLGRGVISVVV